MQRNPAKISAGGIVMLFLLMLNAVVLEQSLLSDNQWYKITYITIPLLLIAIVAHRKKIS